MPQGETFWNPYRLVPVRDQIIRKTPVTEEKFTGYCGSISCSLENLTLLFVGQNRQDNSRFLTCHQKFVIGGSSLKGALRSLSELIGGGCMVTNQQRQDQYKACHNADSLCITCRMFGMMERGKNARVHRGQVAISDALLREDKPQTLRCEVLLNNPKPTHRSFYLNPLTDAYDDSCRKLYFHQPQRLADVLPRPEKLKDKAEPKMALKPGHHFDFMIQFNNLRDDEFALLLYVLVLENEVELEIGQGQHRRKVRGPLRHKLGLGKPLGLGSVQIVIECLTILNAPHQRFRSLTGAREVIYDGDELNSYLQGLIQPFREDVSPTMNQMRKMLVWDVNDPRDFHYPGYNWFKNPMNANTPLKPV